MPAAARSLFCRVASPLVEHPTLRQDKGLMSLPALAFLDAAGEVLVSVPYRDRSVDAIRATGRRAERYVRAALFVSDPGAAWVPGLVESYEVKLRALRRRSAPLGTDP